MGMKPPIYADSPGPTIRNHATVWHKETHHNIAKNTATIPHGTDNVPSESYIVNESTPMASMQLKPLAGKTDTKKGSPRPDLTGKPSYGPTGPNPSEKPLSELKYPEPHPTPGAHFGHSAGYRTEG
jgi:hypothetical protein